MPNNLSRQQLAQLVKECDVRFSWMLVRDFCAMVYGGGRAAKVKLEAYGEYDDEGGTDYRLSNISAWDINGKELQFDLDLPFWQHEDFKDLQARRKLKDGTFCPHCHSKVDRKELDSDLQEEAGELLRDFSFTKEEREHYKNWIAWEELPVEDAHDQEFDLLKEPPVNFTINPSLMPNLFGGPIMPGNLRISW